jgi:hypothetical protein
MALGAVGKHFDGHATIRVPWSLEPTGFFYGVKIPPGIVVVDVDNEDDWRAFLEAHSTPELETFTVRTRRGRHLYYAAGIGEGFHRVYWPEGRVVSGYYGYDDGCDGSDSRPPASSFDLLCCGAFAAVPPSPGYAVLRQAPIAPLPESVARLLRGAVPSPVPPLRAV